MKNIKQRRRELSLIKLGIRKLHPFLYISVFVRTRRIFARREKRRDTGVYDTIIVAIAKCREGGREGERIINARLRIN